VYNIEGKKGDTELPAGAARFKSAFDLYDSKNKLVIFSGDLFFPSLLSTYFEGEQMIMPFERLNVDVSCLGNHELDHGLKTAKELLAKTSCPWLMTNLVNVDDE